MKLKDYAFVGLLIVAIAFLVQPANMQETLAAPQSSTRAQEAQQDSGSATVWEFARLRVESSDQVIWLVGGTQNPRTETVRGLFRRLEGSGNGTFADLLDQIGANGWRLVQLSGNDWIFSRTVRNER